MRHRDPRLEPIDILRMKVRRGEPLEDIIRWWLAVRHELPLEDYQWCTTSGVRSCIYPIHTFFQTGMMIGDVLGISFDGFAFECRFKPMRIVIAGVTLLDVGGCDDETP